MRCFWVIRRIDRDYVEPTLYKSEAAARSAATSRRGYDVLALFPQAEESSDQAEIEAAAPFFRLADEVVNATPESGSYREWLANSQDWTVIFGFAGQNITLGELRKAAAVVRARKVAAPCETCNGRGEIGGWVGQTAESGGYETEPCPDCAAPAEARSEQAEVEA